MSRILNTIIATGILGFLTGWIGILALIQKLLLNIKINRSFCMVI
jgi:hypothetical protein